MTRSEFKNITKHYVGEYKENRDQFWFENYNTIQNYYSNGEIAQRKKVLCYIGFYKTGGFFYGEKTGYILGGGGGFYSDDDKEYLEKLFKKYNFEYIKHPVEQLTLF